jgi:hypothetical protein
MGKSHAIEWNQHSDLKIKIKPTDEVIVLKTNKVSVTPLNRRNYERFKATVLLGSHEVIDCEIKVSDCVRIWTCDIDSRGAVSSIGFQKQRSLL